MVICIVLLAVIVLVVIARGRGVPVGEEEAVAVDKGDYGELQVSQILSLLPDEYHVFNDVYLEAGGRSSQVDHVVISQYGVFVIETKNYSGAVYGSENAERWTQYLNGERYDFRNPIKQNKSHVWVVRNLLHIAQSSIIPIVVFLDGADLRCDTQSTVIYTDQLRDHILSHKTIVFTADGVLRLTQRLSANIVDDPERKQKHIQAVQQGITERELLVANMTCPRCKGQLVERRGKYGQFLGCSNYPGCRFTARM